MALTDDTGAYVLPGVPAGAQTVVASYPGRGDDSTQVQVAYASTTQANALSLVTPPPGTLSIAGRIVLSGETDQSGVQLVLVGPASQTFFTSASGSYSFTQLPAGAYTLTASAADTVERVQQRAITLTNAGATGQDLTFLPAGAIEGTAAISGVPASGVVVYAQGTSVSAVTDANGHYRLAPLQSGRAYVVQGLSQGALSQPVTTGTVVRAQTTSAALLVLAPSVDTAQLKGAATLVSGGSPAGLQVSLKGAGAPITATSGSDGSFTLSAPTGLYDLEVIGDGYSEHLPAGVLVGGTGYLWSDGLVPLAPFELQAGSRVVSVAQEMSVSNASASPDLADLAFLEGSDCDGADSKSSASSCQQRVVFISGGTVRRFDDVGALAMKVGPNHTVVWTSQQTGGPGNDNVLRIGYVDGRQFVFAGHHPQSTFATPRGQWLLSTDYIGSDQQQRLISFDTLNPGPIAVLEAHGVQQKALMRFSPDGTRVVWTRPASELQSNQGSTFAVGLSAGCADGSESCVNELGPATGNLVFNGASTAIAFGDSSGNLKLASADGAVIQTLATNASYGFDVLTRSDGSDAIVWRSDDANGTTSTLSIAEFKLDAAPFVLATAPAGQLDVQQVGDGLVIEAGSGASAQLLAGPISTTQAPRVLDGSAAPYWTGNDTIWFLTDIDSGTGAGALRAAKVVSGAASVIDVSGVTGVLGLDAAGARAAWLKLAGTSELWTGLADGTHRLRLASSSTASQAFFSSDSQRVAWSDQDGALWLGDTALANSAGLVSARGGPGYLGFLADDRVWQASSDGASNFRIAASTAGAVTSTSYSFDGISGVFPAEDGSGLFLEPAKIDASVCTDRFCSTSSHLQLWRLASGAPALVELEEYVNNVHLSPDGLRALWVTLDGSALLKTDQAPSPPGFMKAAFVRGQETRTLQSLSVNGAWLDATHFAGRRAGTPAPLSVQDGIYVGVAPW
ncbi:MAG: carboxypeptidase regulatory-like domain-containing protein [Deltaproteobacteria bacterium]|nr:carboxypeptidase regulatory-like domain-containing protein [Deltaproteobacteria bacterium]